MCTRFVREGLAPDPARIVGFQAAWCAPESGLAKIQAKAIQSRMCAQFVREGLSPDLARVVVFKRRG
jgi:hypothetical protein